MLTRFGNDGPTDEEIRAGWKTDDKTVVIFVDPSCELLFSAGARLRLHGHGMPWLGMALLAHGAVGVGQSLQQHGMA